MAKTPWPGTVRIWLRSLPADAMGPKYRSIEPSVFCCNVEVDVLALLVC
jgi:hypothetical protein